MYIIKVLIRKYFPRKLLKFVIDWWRTVKGNNYSKKYQGSNVYCPCCGKRFSNFMDYKITNLVNKARYSNTYKRTFCPFCFSIPRHRIIALYFEENKQRLPFNRTLFFAEDPVIKWLDRNELSYTVVDLFDRTADIKVDIQNTQFADESWSLILCNHILEHVPDYKKALRELNRILAKDGILEITIPTDRTFTTVYEDKNIVSRKECIEKFGQFDHLRTFGNDFEQILIQFGFEVEVLDGSKLPVQIGGKIGPANYDDNRVYICRKKT
jgi:predicted SAM-dependent methyltransferase